MKPNKADAMVVLRVVAGVFACGMLGVGLLSVIFAGANLPWLVEGFLLANLTGWFAFRNRAQLVFLGSYWVTVILILHLAQPWLPLVRAVGNLPGMTPPEASRQLQTWRKTPYALDEKTGYILFPKKYGSAKGITLEWKQGKVVSALVHWD
ncbi:hypothetical protein [Armatimonas sp.]|uniref:hypothetical protein n=1 Tax=Armatimonas sp. TaxID=1872638 RepID=UPI0037520136